VIRSDVQRWQGIDAQRLRSINRSPDEWDTPQASHTGNGMRHLFEPRLVNGPFGDPGLYVDFRDERRALLFDLGDIAALPPRKLMRVSHVFVSHTHMDHFAGFDPFLRVVLGRKEGIVLVGGPGFVAQVEHKLRAYTWNVVHRYAVALVLDVREIGPDGRGLRARFSSRTGFVREPCAPFEVADDVIHDEALFRVRGRFVDHEMPCLAFVVEEKSRARVAKDRLAALGVSTGVWLRDLKRAVLAGAVPQTPIQVRWRDRLGEHAMTRSVGELTTAILDVAPGQRVGYVTDLRYTDANLRTLAPLLAGVDQLFIESVFLDADRAHAQRKNHLTARQAGQIAREVGARAVVPFHFSPRYGQRAAEVIGEVRAAWSGVEAPPAAADGHDQEDPDASRSWARAML
jgi:ribonuclease Z